jgi:hypothetical protein
MRGTEWGARERIQDATITGQKDITELLESGKSSRQRGQLAHELVVQGKANEHDIAKANILSEREMERLRATLRSEEARTQMAGEFGVEQTQAEWAARERIQDVVIAGQKDLAELLEEGKDRRQSVEYAHQLVVQDKADEHDIRKTGMLSEGEMNRLRASLRGAETQARITGEFGVRQRREAGRWATKGIQTQADARREVARITTEGAAKVQKLQNEMQDLVSKRTNATDRLRIASEEGRAKDALQLQKTVTGLDFQIRNKYIAAKRLATNNSLLVERIKSQAQLQASQAALGVTQAEAAKVERREIAALRTDAMENGNWTPLYNFYDSPADMPQGHKDTIVRAIAAEHNLNWRATRTSAFARIRQLGFDNGDIHRAMKGRLRSSWLPRP